MAEKIQCRSRLSEVQALPGDEVHSIEIIGSKPEDKRSDHAWFSETFDLLEQLAGKEKKPSKVPRSTSRKG